MGATYSEKVPITLKIGLNAFINEAIDSTYFSYAVSNYLVSYCTAREAVYHETTTTNPCVFYDLVKAENDEATEELERDIVILDYDVYAAMDDCEVSMTIVLDVGSVMVSLA